MNVSVPQISIIVPTFNRLSLLKETVNAILAQTFQDFELIIVDNMSEDGTEAYLHNLKEPKIRYFRNPNSGIISVNRNFGIHHARGTYLAFCDDDDLWIPNKLEQQMKLCSEKISAVASNFTPLGKIQAIRKVPSFLPGQIFKDYSFEEILIVNPVISSSVLARKDLVVATGGFDESPEFQFIEDWDLWLSLSRYGKIRISSTPLVQYRFHEKVGRDARKITLNMLKVVKKHEKLGQLNREVVHKALGNCYICIGKAHLDSNDLRGIIFFWRGFKNSFGWHPKIKALGGIVLFCLPLSLRNQLLRFVYASISKY